MWAFAVIQNGLIKIMCLETTIGTHLRFWRSGNYVGHVKRPRQLFHKGRLNPFIQGWVRLRLNTGKSPRHCQILHSSFHVDFQSPFKALNTRTNNLLVQWRSWGWTPWDLSMVCLVFHIVFWCFSVNICKMTIICI